MKHLPIAVILALLSAASALADERRTVTLGSLSLTYDTAEWRSEQTDEGFVGMFPVGRRGAKLDPVYLLQFRNVGGKSCADLALRELGSGMYEEPQGRAIHIGGTRALRLVAPNRCRNAMPKAVVICMLDGAHAYLVKASRPGCHSGANNLFTGIDPLDGLVAGLRLSPS